MTDTQRYYGLDLTTAPPWLESRIMLVTEAGSHAYGLATPASDLDLRGIALEPIEYVVGFAQKFEQFTKHTEEVDMVVYGLTKFCALAAQANPNVLELLFTRPQSVRYGTAAHAELRANRHLFLTQKARHTFSGYAHAQLKKIRYKAANGTTGSHAELIEKHGYDTKHAMHLVRLLRMGKELLTTGELNVFRQDRTELLIIREGGWSLSELTEWAEDMDKQVQEVKSDLPWGPDLVKIDKLCRDLLLASWNL